MNKLKILKMNIISTALLSIVILVAASFIMVIFPLAYYQSFAKISDKDMLGYSEDIADYCSVYFDSQNNHYQELCKTFDMENFVGTATYGYIEYQLPFEDELSRKSISFVSDKLATEWQINGYKFSKNKPEDYREAYAPSGSREIFEEGKIYEISCYEGDYQYKQKIKIIGYKKHDNNGIGIGMLLEDISYNNFVIYDDIPPYAKIERGIMMSDKTPKYYESLGASAQTIRQINLIYKTTEVNDLFLYWCLTAVVLFIVVVTANYYFAADKLIKRSGVMYIYGGKRSSIIFMEILKMLILFILSFAIATVTIAIVIKETGYYNGDNNERMGLVDWKTHFTCVGIMFAVYLASISLGLTKFARFKPLETLANNNIE